MCILGTAIRLLEILMARGKPEKLMLKKFIGVSKLIKKYTFYFHEMKGSNEIMWVQGLSELVELCFFI